MDKKESLLSPIFANDHDWTADSAIMLGRFIALSRFSRSQTVTCRALAVSPQFCYRFF